MPRLWAAGGPSSSRRGRSTMGGGSRRLRGRCAAFLAAGAALAAGPLKAPRQVLSRPGQPTSFALLQGRFKLLQGLLGRRPQAQPVVREPPPRSGPARQELEQRQRQQHEQLRQTSSLSWLLNFLLLVRMGQWVAFRFHIFSGRIKALTQKVLAQRPLNHQRAARAGVQVYDGRVFVEQMGTLRSSALQSAGTQQQQKQHLHTEQKVDPVPVGLSPNSMPGLSLPVNDALAGAVLVTALTQQVLKTAAAWEPIQRYQPLAERLSGGVESQRRGLQDTLLSGWTALTAGHGANPGTQVRAEESSGAGPAQAAGEAAAHGLAIRIFGRWPQPAEWVNIVNIPLSGGPGEKALRALRSAERGTPLVGSLCRSLLTCIVSTQVCRAIGESEWGELTLDLWARAGRRPFELGYEVVEVPGGDRAAMRAAASALPVGGSPGMVVRVPQAQAALVLWATQLAERRAAEEAAGVDLRSSSACGVPGAAAAP